MDPVSTVNIQTTTTTTITTTSSNSIATQLEGSSHCNSTSAQPYEHHAVTIKLPQFWPQSPEVWFITAEAQFSLHRITSENRKYTYLLTALSPDIIQSNIDLIQNPPNPNSLYSSFKEELIKRLIPNEETRITELLYNSEIGDRKPSTFYRYLLQLAGASTEIGNKVIRKIFLDRLPKPIQRTLITIERVPIEEQLSIADKLWDSDINPRYNNNISQVSFDNTNTSEIKEIHSSHSLSSDLSSLRQEFNTLKDLVEKCLKLGIKNNYSNKEKHFNNKFNNSKQKSKSRDSLVSPSDSDLCWYHRKFSNKATKCIKPCKHFMQSEAASSSKN